MDYPLSAGIYIIRVGEYSEKVIVQGNKILAQLFSDLSVSY